MPTSAFVSYSHEDGSLVGPIVALLRASSVLVFRDVDSIVPGKRWRRAIDDAIGQSTVLVLFWCRHTRQSIEVTKEYEAAIAQGKDVLPLLLDDTPLPEARRAFQYLDFQGMGTRHHAAIGPGPPRGLGGGLARRCGRRRGDDPARLSSALRRPGSAGGRGGRLDVVVHRLSARSP